MNSRPSWNMSSFAISDCERCWTWLICWKATPMMMVITKMATISSIIEKPSCKRRHSRFIRALLQSHDHFQADGNVELDRQRGVRTVAAGGYRDQLGVGRERLDVPSHVVDRGAIARGGGAPVIQHGVVRGDAAERLREIDVSGSIQVRARPGGASRRAHGMRRGAGSGIAIGDGHAGSGISGYGRDLLGGHLRQKSGRAVQLVAIVAG